MVAAADNRDTFADFYASLRVGSRVLLNRPMPIPPPLADTFNSALENAKTGSDIGGRAASHYPAWVASRPELRYDPLYRDASNRKRTGWSFEMKRRRNKEPVPHATPEQFVTVWQQSSSLAEVAQKVRAKKNACRVRAFRYRQMGIPLKVFPPPPEPDPLRWDKLVDYAASLLPEDEVKAHLNRVCELCKNGLPGVHRPNCRHFIRGRSFHRCDRCPDGFVVPSNPTYSERAHYCAACLKKRGALADAAVQTVPTPG
jgi:hypothetical protein